MQGIVTPCCQRAIHINQILHAADLRAKNDLVRAQAKFLRQVGGIERAHHHRFHSYLTRILGLVEPRIFVHHAGEQSLVERSPVHSNAHRLLIFHRDFDHGAEIRVAGASNAGVAGINAVLSQIAGALGIFRQQDVPVVVKVANDGHAHALLVEFLDDPRDGGGSLVVVDGDPHQFRSGAGESRNLLDG